MASAATEPLPPEVRRTLAEEGAVSAGEHLVRYAESMARSRPGEALRWGARMARSRFEDEVVTGCAHWAAGVAMYLAGDVVAAEPVLVEAAKRLDGVDDRSLSDRASLLLVDLHGEKSDLGRARRLANRLHRSFSERGDRVRAAAALANLAGAEDAADRVLRARTLWRRAQRDLEAGSLRRLLTDANLANVAALEGRLREAAAGLKKITEEARKVGMGGLALNAELNLAEVEFASGEVDSAFSRWARVLTEARETGNRIAEVAAAVDLATAEACVGARAGARTRLEKALSDARKLGLQGEVVRAARVQATLEAAEGVPGALRRAERDLRTHGSATQRDLLTVEVAQLDPHCDPGQLTRAARRLIREGHLHRGRLGLAWAAARSLDRGHRPRARRLAREVLAARGLSPWIRMVTHHVLGRLGGPQSIRHLLAAARNADAVHGRLAAAADRQAFLSMRGDVYLDLLGALVERNRPADRRRALGVADRLRAGWLLDELARRSDRGNDAEVKRWQELRCRLANLLHDVEGASEPRVRRSGLKIHGEIRSLELDVRQAETDLARRWPVAWGGVESGPANELQRVLPDRECFVEFLLERENLVVFRVRRTSLTVQVIPGSSQELGDLLASVQFHFDAATWLGDRWGEAQNAALDDRLRRLGEILLGPLPLNDIDRLWIAPHAGLFHVPWSALRHPGGRRLLDLVPFTLVPGAGAAAMLLRGAARIPESAAIGGAAAAELPLVEQEMRELAEIAGKASVAVSTTREEFLRLMGEHELVHLAGHALFLDGLPFASGLRLSDGYVTVHDLAATRLAARYVSFGVCSGLRLGRDIGDRYAGFVLALMSGGVRTVVGPVAPVRDDVAYTFDLTLHRRLHETGDPQSAFLDAVTAVRELDPRPATWGSFHQWGDPRAWEKAC